MSQSALLIQDHFRVREVKLSISWKGPASGAAPPRTGRTLKLLDDGFSSFLAGDKVVFYNRRCSPFNCSKDGEGQEGERRENIVHSWQSCSLCGSGCSERKAMCG